MGAAAELCAERFHITRENQDRFAITSYLRAQAAQRRGDFAKEMIPVKIQAKDGPDHAVSDDEELKRFDPEKFKELKPAFKPAGTVTAGNASSVSDGAAALVVMEKVEAPASGVRPLFRIVAFTTSAGEPEWFTTAPIQAISSLLKKSNSSLSDIDLFEINEAFAASSIVVNRELGLDPEKVNVRGGAVALGHPIGASGARILTTLIHAMEDLGKKRGIAALCIGGGEAVAMMVERI
jgi:acetyl-CoA C-acetyltransferase